MIIEEVIAYKLVLHKTDNSIYWIEHFQSIEELDAWLVEEKTRSYYDSTYIEKKYRIVDNVETQL